MRAALLLTLLLSLPASASLPDASFGSFRLGGADGVPLIPKGAELGSRTGAVSGTRWDALADDIARRRPEVSAGGLAKLFKYIRLHPPPNTRYAGLIDMGKPSSQKRFYIIDLASGEVESFLVAHGSGSGMGEAERFSNRENSHMTSLGVFLTGGEYEGKHGRSMRLYGQEASNAAAAERAIVIHGADYVSDSFLRSHGRLGRSWGCPAVDFKHLDHILNRLGTGAALLIYAD